MSRMRPIDAVEQPPLHIIDIRRLKEVATLVASILDFQHEAAPTIPADTSEPLNWACFFLLRDLYDRLFPSCDTKDHGYYVDRDEYDELKLELDRRNTVLLIGQAGAGKTTILRKLEHDGRCSVNAPRTSPLDIRTLAVRLDLGLTSDVLHEAASLLASGHPQPDAALVKVRRELQHLVLSQLASFAESKDLPEFPGELDAYLTCHSDSHRELRLRLGLEGESPSTCETRLKAFTGKEERSEMASLRHDADLNITLEYLRTRFRVVLVLDNVDRWPLTFQELLLQLAIDLGQSRTKVIVAIRASNIGRIQSEGAGANFVGEVILSPFTQEDFAANVFVSRGNAIDRLAAGKVSLEPILAEYSEQLKKGTVTREVALAHLKRMLRDAQAYVSDLLLTVALQAKKRLEDVKRDRVRLGVISMDSDLYAKETEDTLIVLSQLNLGTFASLFRDVLSLLSSTLVDEQVFRFSNNSVRHSLYFYSKWFYTLISAEDPGFWYARLVKQNDNGQLIIQRRVVTNYIYKRMLVANVKGDEANSPSLMCLFDVDEDLNVVAFLLRVLAAMRDGNGAKKSVHWESEPISVGAIESNLVDTFGLRQRRATLRDRLVLGLEALQKMESQGHLGLVWCVDTHDGDVVQAEQLRPSNQFVLTPAGHYVLEVLSGKREFVYWNFMNGDGLELPIQRIAESSTRKFEGVNLSYIGTCHESFHIRAVVFAIKKYLLPRFLSELESVKRGGGAIDVYARNHILLNILDELASNIMKSEEFESTPLNVGFRALLDDVREMRSSFVGAVSARSRG